MKRAFIFYVSLHGTLFLPFAADIILRYIIVTVFCDVYFLILIYLNIVQKTATTKQSKKHRGKKKLIEQLIDYKDPETLRHKMFH